MSRFFLYVDGESLFTRTLERARKKLGPNVCLDAIQAKEEMADQIFDWPTDGPRLRVHPEAKFFWDSYYGSLLNWKNPNDQVARAVYFTAFSGAEEKLHEIRVWIRDQGFEPAVVQEQKQLADRRAHLLNQDGIMERAKGVDIGLAVRIMEDAYLGSFYGCLLFTSDVDFLPVIKAVRRMGKVVCVAGYRDGLSKKSALEFVPDRFFDLGLLVDKEYQITSGPDTPPT